MTIFKKQAATITVALLVSTAFSSSVSADGVLPGNTVTLALGGALVAVGNPLPVTLESGSQVIGIVSINQATPGTTNGVQVNAALPAGTNILGKFGIDQTTPGTTNGVQVNAALPAGTNILGKFGIDQTTPGTTNGVQVNAGSAIIGKVGIDQTTPGTTNGVQINTALPAGANTVGGVTLPNLEAGIAPGTAPSKMVVGGAVYNSSVPSPTNGQTLAHQADSAGNLKVVVAPTTDANVGLALVSSAAAESNHVLKGSAGNLYTLTITIGATTGYLMIFDATSAPADGAVTPKFCKPIISNGTLGADSESWASIPVAFGNGITAVFSSTGCFTKTASATATFSAQVK